MKRADDLVYMVYISSIDGIENICTYYEWPTFEELRYMLREDYISDERLRFFVSNRGSSEFEVNGHKMVLRSDRMFLFDNRVKTDQD